MNGANALVAALAFAACSQASAAATVTVSWIPGAFNPGGRNVGTITYPGGTTGADAGRFQGTITATSGIDPTEFYQGPSSLFAYCYDLAQTLQSGTTYTVVPGAAANVRDFLGAVNAYVAGGDVYDWLNVGTNRDLAAAIQIGIWEGLYDTGFNLTSGAVTFSAVSVAVSTIFTNIVALLNTSDALDSAFVMVLSSGRTQDVITGRRPSVTDLPEPGSLALLGLGAAAAALIRRRRR